VVLLHEEAFDRFWGRSLLSEIEQYLCEDTICVWCFAGTHHCGSAASVGNSAVSPVWVLGGVAAVKKLTSTSELILVVFPTVGLYEDEGVG